MALSIKFETVIKVFGDAAQRNPKGGLVVEDRILATMNGESSARVSLAAGATDIAFNLQNVSGKLVLLQSDKNFSFKLNGGSAIVLKAQDSVPACAMLMTDAITALTLTNPDGTNAIDVDVTVCG